MRLRFMGDAGLELVGLSTSLNFAPKIRAVRGLAPKVNYHQLIQGSAGNVHAVGIWREANRLIPFSLKSTLWTGWNGGGLSPRLVMHTPSLWQEGIPSGRAKPGGAGISPPASIWILSQNSLSDP
jgi:hypothetical protein